MGRWTDEGGWDEEDRTAPEDNIHDNCHYKLATFSRRQKPMCLLGENFQYGLLGEKGCNFIMILSSGEPLPIFSNVA